MNDLSKSSDIVSLRHPSESMAGIGYAAIDMETSAGAYMISGGYSGGDTVKENVEALLKLAKNLNLLGKRGLLVYNIYKNTIYYLLSKYPDIADSPNEDFKEWTKRVLFIGKAAKQVRWEIVKVIIGQTILYYLEITRP